MSKKLVVGPNGAQLVDLTPEEVAQQQVDADAAAAQASADAAEATRLQTCTDDTNYQALLQQAKTATSAQIDNWLTNNVTNLAQARTVLGALIKIVVTQVLR